MRQIAKINHCETPIVGGKATAVKPVVKWDREGFLRARGREKEGLHGAKRQGLIIHDYIYENN